MILCIQAYRLVISPAKLFLFGSLAQCRFHPSCSAFALEAISRHGALRGTWLALKRVARCHPWGGCGHDPVPEKKLKIQSKLSNIEGVTFVPASVGASGKSPRNAVFTRQDMLDPDDLPQQCGDRPVSGHPSKTPLAAAFLD